MATGEYVRSCPYCGELLHLIVDESVPEQRYIEDCQVCCQPIDVLTWLDGDGDVAVSLRRDDD